MSNSTVVIIHYKSHNQKNLCSDTPIILSAFVCKCPCFTTISFVQIIVLCCVIFVFPSITVCSRKYMKFALVLLCCLF